MSVFVQGFHRTDDNNGTSVIFTDNLSDVNTLGTELRRQGIYFACGDDVSPVVLMLDTGQEAAGNCPGLSPSPARTIIPNARSSSRSWRSRPFLPGCGNPATPTTDGHVGRPDVTAGRFLAGQSAHPRETAGQTACDLAAAFFCFL